MCPWHEIGAGNCGSGDFGNCRTEHHCPDETFDRGFQAIRCCMIFATAEESESDSNMIEE